jgi:lysophospholipase L1-like esterase
VVEGAGGSRCAQVLVVADSSALPRASARQGLGDAWPQLLAGQDGVGTVWMRARPAVTAPDLAAELSSLAGYFAGPDAFDAVVVQVGGVDVCPRALPRRLHAAVDRVPACRSFLRANQHRLLERRERPWVSEARYARAVEDIVIRARRFAPLVVLVEIVSPDGATFDRLRFSEPRVHRYNAVLRAAAERHHGVVVVPSVSPGEARTHLLADGQHVSAVGHRALAQRIGATLGASVPAT